MKKLSKLFLTFILMFTITIIIQPEVAFAQPVDEETEQTEETEAETEEEAEVNEETGEGTPVDEDNENPMLNESEQPKENKFNTDIRKQPVQTPSSVTGEKYQGSGTVVDFTTYGSRYIYTIKTPDNNVFYLMIDMDMTENNVYFLSEINQEELTLDDISQQTSTQPEEQQPVDTSEEKEVEEAETQGNSPTFWILLILMSVGILGYHLFFGKLKDLNPFTKNKNNKEETEETKDEDNVDIYNEEYLVDDYDEYEETDDEEQ